MHTISLVADLEIHFYELMSRTVQFQRNFLGKFTSQQSKEDTLSVYDIKANNQISYPQYTKN